MSKSAGFDNVCCGVEKLEILGELIAMGYIYKGSVGRGR
jgi:hypothetical protein